MTQEPQQTATATMPGRQQHVQTLVGMNHCVGTARRDAVYQCLLDYTAQAGSDFRSESPQRRQAAYHRCELLLNDALMAASRSTLSYERQGILDRPAFHILKMLHEIIRTMLAMAAYVQMVQEEASVLSEPLGGDTYAALANSSGTFEANERMARSSFFSMLEDGVSIIKTSTRRHRDAFTPDEERRYQTAYREYTARYADPDCAFATRLLCPEMIY